MPKYAFFDFDGTIIARDSFLMLLKAGLRAQPWRVLFIILFLPILLATWFFKLDKTLAKSVLLWSITVLRGKLETMQFFRKTLLTEGNSVWFEEILAHFEELKKNQVQIIVISASGTYWVRSLLKTKFTNFRMIIGSQLGFCCGGVILKSKNCYKTEKLARINKILGQNFIWHSSWSDHIADLPLLKMAPLRYIISPKNKHLSIFQKELEGNFTIFRFKVPFKKYTL